MIMGIGTDLVYIPEIRELIFLNEGTFVSHTFSEKERHEAENSTNPIEYYAGRFAAKEAIFKAISPCVRDSSFDLRKIETLRSPDGHPEVIYNSYISELLHKGNINHIHISLSHDKDYAFAFAIAEK